MSELNIRPTYHALTSEQKMMVYDYWAMSPRTFEDVKTHFTDLHLTNAIISDCIDYALAQINYFTNYREQEIRIVAEQNKTT